MPQSPSILVVAGEEALASEANQLGGNLFLRGQAQDTPNTTIKIKAGFAYFGNTRIEIADTNTTGFNAPSGNPRIDLVSATSTGGIVITEGAEAGSPVAPTTPIDEIPLTLVYNRVGQSTITNTDDASNGYIYQDIRPTLSRYGITQLTGDASDGDVTISANTTLTRDMYYQNLTVDSAKVLTTAGFKVYVKNTLTNNGTIRWNGNTGGTGATGGNGGTSGSPAANGGVAGTALSDGLLGGGVAGSAGGQSGGGGTNQDGGTVGSVGTVGVAQTNCVTTDNGITGGKGGDRGNYSEDGGSPSNPKVGGNGGAGGASTESESKPRSITSANNGLEMSTPATPVFYKSTASSGAGGGGAGGTGDGFSSNYGGTGGGGGGSSSAGGNVLLSAHYLVNNGTLECNGGDGGLGGNGGSPPPNSTTGADYVRTGGGGGGGGGCSNGGNLVLIFSELENNGTIQVASGAVGVGGTKGTPQQGTAVVYTYDGDEEDGVNSTGAAVGTLIQIQY